MRTAPLLVLRGCICVLAPPTTLPTKTLRDSIKLYTVSPRGLRLAMMATGLTTLLYSVIQNDGLRVV